MALVDGLNHLLVQVSDLERSEAFYRDTFELELVGAISSMRRAPIAC